MLRKQTLTFLTHLQENNDRFWFRDNRKDYDLARLNFIAELKSFTDIATKVDMEIKDSQRDRHMFRINRDVRFSKNKKPYKSHMSGYICPGGKQNIDFRACYYLHIEPFNSFVGGGSYAPCREYLEKIRKRIVTHGDELAAIIIEKKFQKYFGQLNSRNMLKTAPRGYSKDHEHIDLLKYKGFSAQSYISDIDLETENGYKEYEKRIRALQPFVNWLNNIHI